MGSGIWGMGMGNWGMANGKMCQTPSLQNWRGMGNEKGMKMECISENTPTFETNCK